MHPHVHHSVIYNSQDLEAAQVSISRGVARKAVVQPWPCSSVASSVVHIHQSCGFDPWSGHIQESTNEFINKWNNESGSLSLSLSLSQINQNIFFKKAVVHLHNGMQLGCKKEGNLNRL